MMRIKICVGTTCHLMGGSLLADAVKNNRLYKKGEIKLEYATCFGACNGEYLSPVVEIDNKLYDDMNVEKLINLMEDGRGDIR